MGRFSALSEFKLDSQVSALPLLRVMIVFFLSHVDVYCRHEIGQATRLISDNA